MQRAPKISDSSGGHFNVHCHCIIAILLWSTPSMYLNNYITMCVADESNTDNCMFHQYTWVKRTFGTGKFQPSNLTSSAFYVFAHQRLFPCTFPPIQWVYLRDSTRKCNRGWRRVPPHGITQPHLVRWQGLHTIHYSCTLCYWNIMFTFFKWPLFVPFELPMAMLGRQ